ncbi:hypothetical protein Btru_061854 [Bulinus truncatus]|nr:hypothetical protein Btru_061854 [Bulinus truncatus]
MPMSGLWVSDLTLGLYDAWTMGIGLDPRTIRCLDYGYRTCPSDHKTPMSGLWVSDLTLGLYDAYVWTMGFGLDPRTIRYAYVWTMGIGLDPRTIRCLDYGYRTCPSDHKTPMSGLWVSDLTLGLYDAYVWTMGFGLDPRTIRCLDYGYRT